MAIMAMSLLPLLGICEGCSQDSHNFKPERETKISLRTSCKTLASKRKSLDTPSKWLFSCNCLLRERDESKRKQQKKLESFLQHAVLPEQWVW